MKNIEYQKKIKQYADLMAFLSTQIDFLEDEEPTEEILESLKNNRQKLATLWADYSKLIEANK